MAYTLQFWADKATDTAYIKLFDNGNELTSMTVNANGDVSVSEITTEFVSDYDSFIVSLANNKTFATLVNNFIQPPIETNRHIIKIVRKDNIDKLKMTHEVKGKVLSEVLYKHSDGTMTWSPREANTILWGDFMTQLDFYERVKKEIDRFDEPYVPLC